MKEETLINVWKESFLIKIRFLTRNDDLRKVAGNWTWPEAGPHTVHTNTLQCVRSLLFLTLTFNDSYYHIRIEVCEITLL